jgi:predicted ester cyclase
MSLEQNKATALRIPLEVFNRGDLAMADEVMAADYVEHALVPTSLPPSLAGFKLFVSALLAAFPDFQYTVDDVIAEGDKVVVRLTAHGTQKAEFFGLLSFGKQATWSEIHIMDIADGKVVEHWVVQDQFGMMQQLGFHPRPKK